MSRWKIAAVSLLLLAAGAASYLYAIEAHRKANPQSAFASLVDIRLPAGVQVISYANSTNDAYVHKAHVWLLEGEEGALRKMVEGTRSERSDEDARWLLPDAAALFGLQLNPGDLAEGYELEESRDRWFLIAKGKPRAIYIQ